MANFMELIEKDLNYQETENRAIGFGKSLSPLVDVNFKTPSYRDDKKGLRKDFTQAILCNPFYAIKWAFMARDCRGGAGERDLFRTILPRILTQIKEKEDQYRLLELVPVYGRWDDLWVLLGTEWQPLVLTIVYNQILEDIGNYNKGEEVSLLAKWLPSDNASSKASRIDAAIIKRELFKHTNYRRLLKKLRERIDIVERKMSANQWDKINYEAVPSRAAMLYRNAFDRHDENGYGKFLEDVEKGEKKINAETLFPHDIVYSYTEQNHWFYKIKEYDNTLEALWKALPSYGAGGTTLVVQDSSGSMEAKVSQSSRLTAMDVAIGMAIYFAERAKGPYNNSYITFSSKPKYVKLNKEWSLRDKLEKAHSMNIIENTNIEATFDLILSTAVRHGLKQDELPENVLIISDMEFDQAAREGGNYKIVAREALFEGIERSFTHRGYKMPKLVFWNVASRTNTIPLQETENGLVLISGYSPSLVKMVVDGVFEPEAALISMLDTPRYEKLNFLQNKI